MSRPQLVCQTSDLFRFLVLLSVRRSLRTLFTDPTQPYDDVGLILPPYSSATRALITQLRRARPNPSQMDSDPRYMYAYDAAGLKRPTPSGMNTKARRAA